MTEYRIKVRIRTLILRKESVVLSRHAVHTRSLGWPCCRRANVQLRGALFGIGIVDSTFLKKGVAKNAIGFRGPAQIGYALIEVGFAHEPQSEGELPNPFDHCGKSLLCESFDQFGLAGVDVNHSRRDMDLAKASFP